MSDRETAEPERPAFVDPHAEDAVCHFCGQTWEPTAVDGFDLSSEDEYYPKMVPVCPERGRLQMTRSCVRCRRDWGSGSTNCPNCGGVSRAAFDAELLAADGGEPSTEEEKEEYLDPLATVDGETEVEIACAVAGDATLECDGWSETVELDAPANYDNGRIELPGFYWECPECGNPHEFEVNGMRVTNLV